LSCVKVSAVEVLGIFYDLRVTRSIYTETRMRVTRMVGFYLEISRIGIAGGYFFANY
jgi:hypothetical protein